LTRRRALAVALGVALFCSVFVPLQVDAAQPYVGGYFLHGVVKSTSVLLRVDFQRTDTDEAPIFPHFVGPITSVAGSSSGTEPSGVVYQNLVGLRNNNLVTWQPQAWYEDSRSVHLSYRDTLVNFTTP
jgi:hypothetical protein